jgi:serine/threonine protein kinase
MPLSRDHSLGPYRILALLGVGGMGEVYRARDPRLGRDVAIKVLPASFSEDAERLRRFEQEARAAGVLNHPNITTVYDIGTHDGSPYVVQELLEGRTLRAVLAAERLSPSRAVSYAIQVANGLGAAHEKGIVHRDLKPENVFVTNDGRVKILDFGLAKLVRPQDPDLRTDLPTASPATEPGVLVGTIGYMSPEQLRGQRVDGRSDLFSFGVVLYEMLSGSQPFLRSSPADTMMAILSHDPPPISKTGRGISATLNRIVSRCLEKMVDARFQHAQEVAFALESVSAHLSKDDSRGQGLRWMFLAAAVIAILAGTAVLRRTVPPAENSRKPPPITALPPLPVSASGPLVTPEPAPAVPRTASSARLTALRPTAAKRVFHPTPVLAVPADNAISSVDEEKVPPVASPAPASSRPASAETSPRPVSDSELIRETLQEYRRALNTLDVDRYVRIFPSFAGVRRRELENSWKSLRSQSVELDIHQIEPAGDRAVVRVRQTLTGVPFVGSEQRDVREAVFSLEKRDGSWVITAFR